MIYERSLNRRRGESQTRPSPIHGNGSVRRPPTRTLCHGWSEPGAAVKWCRPKFCADQGPVARKESTPGTVFCAPEILRKGVGVSPVTGGPGVVRLWAGTPIGAHPRRRFGSFFAAKKGTRPKGETLRAEQNHSEHWRAGRCPAPAAFPGRVRTGTESTTPRRTLTKKGMAGLNYHKMYHNVPLLTSAQHGWRCFLWLAITQQILNYVNGRRTTR